MAVSVKDVVVSTAKIPPKEESKSVKKTASSSGPIRQNHAKRHQRKAAGAPYQKSSQNVGKNSKNSKSFTFSQEPKTKAQDTKTRRERAREEQLEKTTFDKYDNYVSTFALPPEIRKNLQSAKSETQSLMTQFQAQQEKAVQHFREVHPKDAEQAASGRSDLVFGSLMRLDISGSTETEDNSELIAETIPLPSPSP